jgi:hypothetical protein
MKLAKEFGLSDRGLAKVCARHEIPVPGRGYWARVASGQRIKKRPLSRPDEGGESVAIKGSGPPPPIDPLPPEVLLQVEFERRAENLIVVPEEISRLHALVRTTRDSLAPQMQDAKRGLVSSGPGSLHLRVSHASKARALRILDTFVKACEVRGFTLKPSASSAAKSATIVKVHGEDVPMTLEEKCRQVEHVLTAAEKKELERGRSWGIEKYEIVPTGVLVLAVDEFWSRVAWRDGKKHRLESCLNDVMVALVQVAIQVVRPRRQQHEEDARKWKEQAKRDAIERRRREILEKGLKEWRYVVELDRFLTSCREAMTAAGVDLQGSSAQAEWFRWAEKHKRSLDPFPELFEDIHEEVPSYYYER